MKKNKLLIIFIIATMIISISSIVLGDFSGRIKSNNRLSSTSEVADKFNQVIGIIQVIAVGIAVITLIALAIKFMVASAGEKAEIKKHVVVYVTGAVLLFGASGILQIFKLFGEGMLK